jgi:hypothetical protein
MRTTLILAATAVGLLAGASSSFAQNYIAAPQAWGDAANSAIAQDHAMSGPHHRRVTPRAEHEVR